MGKAVLVVDDSSTVRNVVKKALLKESFNAIEAEDGNEALRMLSENEIDLVICDLHMPVKDGIAFLEEMKSNAEYQKIPVIMLTTETNIDLQQRAKELGAIAWMRKPFKPEILLKAVNKILG